MHVHELESYRHAHAFTTADFRRESRTLQVIALTAVTMVVEVIVGWLSGSMALLADGWHMGSHVVALGITWAAYVHARRHADDAAFAFGTGKIGVLAGFTSAVLLAVVALLMAGESLGRLMAPVPIDYGQAMAVAAIGLAVNIASMLLLGHDEHGHEDKHHAHDHNMRAAALHVMADAVTSAAAILALAGAWLLDWRWLDPIAGLAGAALIGHWAWGLLRDGGRVLLDRSADDDTRNRVRAVVEADADNLVADLHVWPVAPDQFAAIVTVVTHYPHPPSHYKDLLRPIDGLVHVTIEVHAHPGAPCRPCPDMADRGCDPAVTRLPAG